MKKLTLGLVAFSLVALSACKIDKGSGTPKTEKREPGTFTEIAVSAGIETDVEVGPTPLVEVRADDNLLSHVKTVVTGDRLAISIEGVVSTKTPIHVNVVTARVTALDAASGAHLSAKGVAGDALAIAVGSGAHLTVSGSAKSEKVTVSSGGHLDAGGLSAESVDVTASSGADVTVNATQAVSGALSSGAHAHVHGHPTTKKLTQSSGAELDYP